MRFNPIILLLLLLFLSNQCTIQKRVYRTGWHISRKTSPSQLASKNENNQFKTIQENHVDEVPRGKEESQVMREIDTIFELPIQARVEQSQLKDSSFSSIKSNFVLNEAISPKQVKSEQKVSSKQKKKQTQRGRIWSRSEKLVSILILLVVAGYILYFLISLIQSTTFILSLLFLWVLFYLLLASVLISLIVLLLIPTEEFLSKQRELREIREIERQRQREIELEKQREIEKQLELEREKQRVETGQPENEVDSTIQPNDANATPKGQLSSTTKSVIAVIAGIVLIGLFYLFLN